MWPEYHSIAIQYIAIQYSTVIFYSKTALPICMTFCVTTQTYMYYPTVVYKYKNINHRYDLLIKYILNIAIFQLFLIRLYDVVIM